MRQPPTVTLPPELEQLVVQLEQDVATFAQHLSAAQDAGVSHAILLPRMMLAFRRSFGEPPPGFALPNLAGMLSS